MQQFLSFFNLLSSEAIPYVPLEFLGSDAVVAIVSPPSLDHELEKKHYLAFAKPPSKNVS